MFLRFIANENYDLLTGFSGVLLFIMCDAFRSLYILKVMLLNKFEDSNNLESNIGGCFCGYASEKTIMYTKRSNGGREMRSSWNSCCIEPNNSVGTLDL